MTETGGQHRPGRWLGGLVFLIGLAMMVAVFALAAIAFFQVPEALISGSDEGLGRPLAVAGAQVGFLLVMAYLSSLFASKGLELFTVARVKAED
jgi:ABC-type nickel/cobalt efflux system permease component RcnA